MKAGSARIRAGEAVAAAVAAGAEMIRSAGFALDYLEARHAETLAPIGSLKEARSACWWRPGSAPPA